MLTRARELLARVKTALSLFIRRRFNGQWTDSIQQRFAIPTYFPSDGTGDHDWTSASAGPLLGIVVINPASGPSYLPDYINGIRHDEFQERIDEMHVAGADVVGYVTTNYRDSRDTTVQGEHQFTVAVATNIATAGQTGWWTGFGPIQVRPGSMMSTLPSPLAVSTDYFWISLSPTTGRFATSKTNAINNVAISVTSTGGPGWHLMGLSRTLKNIANVFFEIDQFYLRWSGIDGMFLDEMNDTGDAMDADYYGQIYDHVRAKGGKALVIENPGKHLPVSMLNCADVFMTFEGPSSDYAAYDASLEMAYPASMFWHAIYACPASAMTSTIDASRRKNAGYIYVTDRGSTDPSENLWNHIASYFHDEVMEVRNRNTPPAVMDR